MRRSILLAVVAALALALGLNSVALAGQDGAAVSAKKANKKGKKKRGCKGKGKAKGKNKGKARASARAKKKGKNRGCKGKGKGKGGSLLTPGTYEGEDGIGLKVTAGGRMASLIYSPSGGRVQTCIPVALELPEEAATSTPTSFKAGGKPNSAYGGNGEITWTIEVTTGLRYSVRIDSSHAFPEQDPCNAPGAVFRGTLKKTG